MRVSQDHNVQLDRDVSSHLQDAIAIHRSNVYVSSVSAHFVTVKHDSPFFFLLSMQLKPVVTTFRPRSSTVLAEAAATNGGWCEDRMM